MEDLTTLKPYANLRFSFYYLLVIKVPKLPDERRLDGIKDRGGLGELWKEDYKINMQINPVLSVTA